MKLKFFKKKSFGVLLLITAFFVSSQLQARFDEDLYAASERKQALRSLASKDSFDRGFRLEGKVQLLVQRLKETNSFNSRLNLLQTFDQWFARVLRKVSSPQYKIRNDRDRKLLQHVYTFEAFWVSLKVDQANRGFCSSQSRENKLHKIRVGSPMRGDPPREAQLVKDILKSACEV